jgi:hypothetical protein
VTALVTAGRATGRLLACAGLTAHSALPAMTAVIAALVQTPNLFLIFTVFS